MRLIFSLIACLLIMSPVLAGETDAPRMTGQEFFDLYFGKGEGGSGDETILLNRRLAAAYLGGVADHSQGSDWCDKTLVKTIEIDAEVAHAMRQMPKEVLQKDAARSVVKILGQNFPCH